MRRADQTAGTARNGLTFQLHNRGIAFWTAHRHDETRRVYGPLCKDHGGDLRNDIARASHHHRIADTQILATNFIFIVQRRVGYGGAAHEHRLQSGDGGNGAGAANLHVDTKQDGGGLLGRKLVGDGEARRTRNKS